MKILSLHCDYIKFKPVKKALKQPEKLTKAGEKEREVREALVILTAVEEQDENNKQIVKQYVENVKDLAKQVSCKNVVLYPYAHLSSFLSKPEFAEKTMKQAEKQLKKEKFKVTRAPFGYYKQFELKCKGHPLAELSREIGARGKAEKRIERGKKEEEKESEALKAEDGIMKELFVILPDGKIVKRKQLKKECEDIEEVIKDELGERKPSGKEPPHLKLMHQLEIASIERRVSDAGNLRYLPKGEFIVELLKDLCWDIFIKRLKAMPIKTPCIVSKEDKGAKWMMEKFPERLYKVLPGREEKKQEFYLRPACDYGALSIFKDAVVSYKNLPLPLYEFEDNSWRYEQRGELLGMYRIRNFMMADLHTMCSDLEQTFIEYERQIREFAVQIYYELGFKPASIILNCKRDFYDKYKKKFVEWSRNTKLPIIVKLFKEMKTYKVAWVDVVALDNLKRPMEVTTVQLDTETPKYWDIKYMDKDNKKKHPVILHTGIGIDRSIAALLENAAAEERGNLPYWLSPTQVRILPLSEKYVKEAEELAKDLNENQRIRTDVDDRDLPLAKKVSDAEKEWIPDIVTIGEKELQNQILSVRIRKTGKVEEMKPHFLRNILRKRQGDMPWRPLPLPMLLSKRAKFV